MLRILPAPRAVLLAAFAFGAAPAEAQTAAAPASADAQTAAATSGSIGAASCRAEIPTDGHQVQLVLDVEGMTEG